MALTDHARAASQPRAARRIATLAFGDLVAFHAITTIGLASHGELSGLSSLGLLVEVAMPFAIGWFAVAPFAGLFKASIATQPRRALLRTSLAWLLALPIGLLLWSIVRQKPVQPAFAVVTFITNLVALLGWRGIYAWLAQRSKDAL